MKVTRIIKLLVFTALCCASFGPAVAQQRTLLSGERQESGVSGETATGQMLDQSTKPVSLPLLEGVVDPDEYVLGPYDGLLIMLMGPESRSFSLRVLPEGDVVLPGVGAIRADGLTLNEFRIELEKRVSKYFRNIELFCYLQMPREFRVFVTGEVANPGAAEVSSVRRVSDAVNSRGGVTERGSRRSVTLERDGRSRTVDLLRFLQLGDFENNPFLRSGDRIHVPPAGSRATIRGQVGMPGIYEIIEDETVGGLIELAGGFTSSAFEDSVLVSRIEGEGIMSSAVLPKARFDMELKDRDVINVFEDQRSTKAVFVFGAVANTGRYDVAPDEDLSRLLVRIDGFNEFADLEGATIERKSGELIRVNLETYLPPDPDRSFLLQDGDMLDIPFVPTNVAVGGEVNEPGAYPYRNEFTVAQYIGLAGGPTREGSINRIMLISPDGTSRNADGGTRPDRGDVIIVKRARSRIFGEFFSGLIGLGALVISIIALTQ